MKRLICILLAMLLLCGCGATAGGEDTSKEDGLRLQIDGQEVRFTPWEQAGIPLEGSYYLTQDVVLEEAVTITGDLKLHLNGHTVSGKEGVYFGSVITVSSGGALTVCDEPAGGGKLASPRSFSANLTVDSFIRVAGTVTVAGGTVDASYISLEDTGNGAGFYVEEGGVLNVTGGTIIGGTTWCSALTPPPPEAPADPTAESQPAEGQPVETQPAETQPMETQPAEEVPFEILGKGGSVYVAAGGACNITGGEIREGSAGLGGNLYVEPEGKITMSGGTIADGEAVFHGGNVYISGAMEITDGSILQGGSYNHGGNFYIEGTLEMTGGRIVDGVCDVNSMANKKGGNICVNGKEALVHIANAEIKGGTAAGGEGFGGNISVVGYGAKEFLIEDTTISDGIGHRAGNLYIGTIKKDISPENLDYKLVNVTLQDGSAGYRGSNICVDSDVRDVYIILNMENCDLIDTSNSSKDNISVGAGAADETWCEVTMTGGSIQGGTLTIYGLATLTTYGTKLDQTEHAYSGELIINP